MNKSSATALVVGGSTGIGLATSRSFARAGWKVLATGREQTSGMGFDDEATAHAPACGVDVSRADSVRCFVNHVATEGIVFDAVVFACGDGRFQPLTEADGDYIDRCIQVNLTGPLRMAQMLLPYLRDHSSIVFVGSSITYLGYPGAHAYAAAKSGLVAAARCMANELGPSRGIRVNVVSPGAIRTGAFEKLGLDSVRLERALAPNFALGRFGDAEEVADAVRALVDEMRYVTGAELVIDGGMQNAGLYPSRVAV